MTNTVIKYTYGSNSVTSTATTPTVEFEYSGPGLPPPAWAISYVRSVEFQRMREFIHAHLDKPGEPLRPLAPAEVAEQARIIAASCTIENVATLMQTEAELRVGRHKYGFLDGSPFVPGSISEVVTLDGCRFRPACDVEKTTTAI